MSMFRRIFGHQSNPICASCGKGLEPVDMARGAVVIVIGKLPTLYSGVVCQRCGKIECKRCKHLGGRIDDPCTWCGSKVSPAYEHLI